MSSAAEPAPEWGSTPLPWRGLAFVVIAWQVTKSVELSDGKPLLLAHSPAPPGVAYGLWLGLGEQPGLHGHGAALSRGCEHHHPLDGGLG